MARLFSRSKMLVVGGPFELCAVRGCGPLSSFTQCICALSRNVLCANRCQARRPIRGSGVMLCWSVIQWILHLMISSNARLACMSSIVICMV